MIKTRQIPPDIASCIQILTFDIIAESAWSSVQNNFEKYFVKENISDNGDTWQP